MKKIGKKNRGVSNPKRFVTPIRVDIPKKTDQEVVAPREVEVIPLKRDR